MEETSQRFGFVTLCGAPNAGKSTLLNRLVGEKVAAVSSKPQTTRVNVLCVKEFDEAQVAFIDSPGLFAPATDLGRLLRKHSLQAFKGADVVAIVIDLSHPRQEENLALTDKIIQRYADKGSKLMVVLNKIDLVKKAELVERAALFQRFDGVQDFFMISAEMGEHVDDFQKALVEALPQHFWEYPPQSDLKGDLKTWLAEQTREKVFDFLREEIPYQAYVETLSLQEAEDGLHIYQNIVVAKESQKRVVIGHRGSMIKQIGQASRKNLIHQLRRRLHLHLLVKVQPQWMSRPQTLRDAGLV